MGLRIAYSSIFLALETFPVNVCFCSTLVLFQPLLMFWLQVPGFGLLDRITTKSQNQHRIIIILTTTTTTVIVIFNLPAILTHCLGRISSKNLRGSGEGCVSESGLLMLDLHILTCERLASGPYFEMLEGPCREGTG